MKTAKIITKRLSKLLFWLFLLICLGAIAVIGIFAYYSGDLPSTKELQNYYPKTTTRLYDANGGLLAEYAEEKRIFVPITSIPDVVKEAFISAEDQNFYKHSGVDIFSIFRAIARNTLTKLTGEGGISGGSTITQQVIKNLLLTNERSLTRKIKEAILAVRVTQSMSKDKILEIYLNEIFLGNRSYGVVAAAYNYFNKSIDELTIEEAALLAAMPKAPSDFDPRRNYERAFERRNYVIDRMHEEDYITKEEAEVAKAKDIELAQGREKELATNHFAEEVRRFLMEKYGEEQVYGGGMTVRTTLDPKLQKFAEQALYDGLTNYDRQRGYRGSFGKIAELDIWKELLAETKAPEGLGPWKLAVVLAFKNGNAELGFKDGTTGILTPEGVKWTGRSLREMFKPGELIAVSLNDKKYKLEQIPAVNGGLVVMNPENGRVLAMVGGYPYGDSSFNRVTQAKRQPGSAFKPFVYLAALESGFLPTTVVNDGPLVVSQGPGMPMWAPKNYGGDFLGQMPLRTALAKSRNNVTVLLALMLGVDKIQEIAKRMAIIDKPAPCYSMVLGAQETTLMRLAVAYSVIANSGKRVRPVLIDRVQDRTGKTIFRGDRRECTGCSGTDISKDAPVIVDNSKQIVDPAAAYQLTTMLQDVVERGTATRAKSLGRPLAGKTGTTNDSYDTWFMGYSPDMVVGTYIGYDRPKTLGRKATGGSVALPVFIEFMQNAMKDVPPKPFQIPAGVRLQRIDIATGRAPDEYSIPANIKLEVINPRAPQQIEYSEEYRQKYLGIYDTGGGSIDSGLY